MKATISRALLFSNLLLLALAACSSSSKDETGDTGNGISCQLGGNGNEACTSCVSSNCASLTEKCSEPGGPCSSFVECASKCDCGDTSCTSKCGQPSKSCAKCLGESTECVQEKCASECGSGGDGDAGNGDAGNGGSIPASCKKLKECCGRIPASHSARAKLCNKWYEEYIVAPDGEQSCASAYNLCNEDYPAD